MNIDIFFSYSHKDVGYIRRLIEKLSTLGIECGLTEDFIGCGESYMDIIPSRISSARIVVILLTENSFNSVWVQKELEFAISSAKNRDKIIFPIAQWGKKTIDAMPNSFKYMLSTYQMFFPEDGLHSEEDYNKVAGIIADILKQKTAKEYLYSQIAEFKKINYTEKAAVKLSELIVLLYNQIGEERNFEKRISIYQEICNCAIELNHNTGLTYGNDAKNSAKSIFKAVYSMRKMLCEDDFRNDDLLIISIAVIVINCMLNIWDDCIDTWTNGVQECYTEDLRNYTSQHDMYCILYNQLINKRKISKENHKGYSAAQADIIILAKDYFTLERSVPKKKEETDYIVSDEEKKLWEIAEYIEKSNHIFDLIGDKKMNRNF